MLRGLLPAGWLPAGTGSILKHKPRYPWAMTGTQGWHWRITSFKLVHLQNSVVTAWRLQLNPSLKKSFCSSGCFNRSWFMEGTWDAPKCGVLSSRCFAGLGIGIDVAILANQIHFCGVIGTSASARMSSKVSLLKMGGLPRLGTWPFCCCLLIVFMVPGTWSITSLLSWLRLETVGGCWQGLSGKDL